MNAQEPAPTRRGLSTPEELLTVPQVMARLQPGRSAAYDLLRTRELAWITLGRARRIPTRALADFIRTRLSPRPRQRRRSRLPTQKIAASNRGLPGFVRGS